MARKNKSKPKKASKKSVKKVEAEATETLEDLEVTELVEVLEVAEATEALELEQEEAPTEEKMALNPADLQNIEQAIEALIFACPKPISTQRIRNYLESAQIPTEDLQEILNNLVESYKERGIQIVRVGKSYQFRTNATQAPIVQKLVEDKPARLSKSALEVLSIVSYKQPITRAEIDSIRGIDSGHLMKGLLEKNLVRTDGHAETAGRPLLFVTTPYFLEVFGLDSLDSLPNLEEFQRELNSGAEGDDTTILGADPDFFDRDSPLAANPDRGDFDNVAEEEVHSPDFGLLEHEDDNEEEESSFEEQAFQGPPAEA